MRNLYIRALIALLPILGMNILLAGCGGGGGGGSASNESRVRSRFNTFWGDWERESSRIMRNFSEDYVNNGYDYSDVRDLFNILFSAPGTTYRIKSRDLGSVTIFEPFAQVSGSYVIEMRDSSGTYRETVGGPFYLVNEDRDWLFYGNQGNLRSPDGQKTPIQKLISALKQEHTPPIAPTEPVVPTLPNDP